MHDRNPMASSGMSHEQEGFLVASTQVESVQALFEPGESSSHFPIDLDPGSRVARQRDRAWNTGNPEREESDAAADLHRDEASRGEVGRIDCHGVRRALEAVV